ncbi:glycosyltransferase family 4 protein [Synechococcus sp. Cruz-9H2]|uniref:glycosyltransferase family 4 protein n=1 Tax=unclassified Synechococcus TaxID=2626047 RepID=UPI0020CEB32B|nr:MULTISPECIES: glycosyltransferase family 4 protein [unclassified Synechococcus]MCP9818838.1 glycosyltransferase family 4 protein [Synechococcus sp. Cruz-9H2]MCP9843341.1 glycosyltransferase family 4 protein [Synechococcus sp. Edmonson 11F2]MCP9855276.1 glycosyltransferase family 4 protein [Synechococcus sp. Cruz-9C9]MCP9862751.1 glycosyltransferase family 4 protein [Synechococcus sp. Cruz-7E5]MCP9869748.1 glycosyltransferase family 4 protein [Synechococcus sp. Cruz-7B9]
MKILLLNDYGAPIGGAERQLVGLREAFRARGHQVRLLTSTARPQGLPQLADTTCLGTLTAARTALQVANPWALSALQAELRRFRPEIVHVKMFLTQLSPLILKSLAAVPAIYHASWYRAVCPIGSKRFPDGTPCRVSWGSACLRRGCLSAQCWPLMIGQMALLRRWRQRFRGVVANSQAVRERLLEDGFPAVEVIPNGVPICSQRPPLNTPPTLAFAGRLEPEKGVEQLLDSMVRVCQVIPQARLLIAGSGGQSVALREQAVRLGLGKAVQFLGFLGSVDMENALRRAWVQVVPSLWEEPFGLVAAEGLMRGTAVVASASGGLVDIIRHGETGLLVRPGDTGALSEAIINLLNDRNRCERMGQVAREDALERFSENLSAERFLRFYATVLAREAELTASRAAP